MIYKFEAEIKALENSNINDKERIFYIYIDMYRDIITALDFGYKFLVPEFSQYLKDLFIDNVTVYNSNNNDVDFIKFYTIMLEKLRERIVMLHNQKISTTNSITLLRIIYNYLFVSQPENTDYIVNEDYRKTMRSIVDALNSTGMDFYTKANTMLIIKDYLNNFSNTFNSLYNPYNQSADNKNHLEALTLAIIILIPLIIKKSYGYDTFKSNLEKATYDLLKDVIDDNNSYLKNFDNKKLAAYYNSLNEKEKELFMSLIIQSLSGYKNQENKFRDNFKKRNILRKLNKSGYNMPK